MADTTILDTTCSSTLAANVEFSHATDSAIGISLKNATITEAEGVPNLKETGYDCVRYMGTVVEGEIELFGALI